MKFPICKKCLKDEILCDKCATEVGKKLIKIDEIRMYKSLDKFGKKYEALKDVEVHRLVDSPKMER